MDAILGKAGRGKIDGYEYEVKERESQLTRTCRGFRNRKQLGPSESHAVSKIQLQIIVYIHNLAKKKGRRNCSSDLRQCGLRTLDNLRNYFLTPTTELSNLIGIRSFSS